MENNTKEKDALTILQEARCSVVNNPYTHVFAANSSYPLEHNAAWLTLYHAYKYLDVGEKELDYLQKLQGKPSLKIQYSGLKQKQITRLCDSTTDETK